LNEAAVLRAERGIALASVIVCFRHGPIVHDDAGVVHYGVEQYGRGGCSDRLRRVRIEWRERQRIGSIRQTIFVRIGIV
jgi:hypothetical protein